MSDDLLGSIYEDLTGKTPEDKEETQREKDAEWAEKKEKLKDPFYAFCWAHYYSYEDEDDHTWVIWEPFEGYSEDDIEEMIENDITALKEFMSNQKKNFVTTHKKVKEALRGKSEEDKEATREEMEKPVKCPKCKKVIDRVDATQANDIEILVEGNRANQIVEEWGGNIEDVRCHNCKQLVEDIIEIDL